MEYYNFACYTSTATIISHSDIDTGISTESLERLILSLVMYTITLKTEQNVFTNSVNFLHYDPFDDIQLSLLVLLIWIVDCHPTGFADLSMKSDIEFAET